MRTETLPPPFRPIQAPTSAIVRLQAILADAEARGTLGPSADLDAIARRLAGIGRRT